jgi:hypothetical protein
MSRRRRDHNRGRQLERRAYHRQRGLCFWCQQPMELLHRSGAGVEINPRLMTAEHVEPVARGGRTHASERVARREQLRDIHTAL